ncbi:conserved hypothetical protein [Histoplasma capsulatum H143]|uniref:Erythromycin esterase n=1 Tax=Ajellomyces capsulatus (strain H143) TaxID=544712 RepID=C6H1Q8_AJECH|nr:conserved hypothetical protein [Histoplasma capsulatum H143]
MATPVRRSTRLRSTTPASDPQKQASKPSTKLISVAEREENLDMCSPQNSRTLLATPATAGSHTNPSIMKTPKTAGALKPSLAEMHPSKVHQNTSKKPDSGARLGFKPIPMDSPCHPRNPSTPTPTKSRLPAADQLNSPNFSMLFSCEDSQLNEEAKKLMENIREDASRIKAQMIIEQNSQECKNNETEPTLERQLQAALMRHLSEKSGTVFTSPGKTMSISSQAFEVFRASQHTGSGQHGPRSLITPKKPMIARASSAKQINTTKIPSFPRSPSTKSIVAPRTPQTEFNPKLKTGLPSLTNLKSILRQRQPLFSTDPVKIAAGTHVAPPTKIFDIQVEGSTAKKHVDFSASTKLRHAFSDTSPTPSKILAREPAESGVISYPTLPLTTPPKANSKEDERSQKRLKPNPTLFTNVHTPSPIKNSPMRRVAQGTGSHSRSTQKNRGVLTMSRLNMLSKPKARR